ncbi:MAG: CCA tRNA nucleotidyltransferase [Paracoccaceae bacterium]|nr:CCA tRNA nucleotidyltransferase [Paracoccaceae bacterium]
MKLSGDWYKAAAPQRLCSVLDAGGHQALFVGGCVRNDLLGAAVSDIDIATDARPERMIELAKAAGLKSIPTGIDHGTVTVVVSGTAFEVTSFRTDVSTDGRRAVVAFCDDITADAQRRDFTMNALYAQASGAVIDPLEGLGDLRARRVRFIKDAAQRIKEDYLRILRFFRFSAWYGDPQLGFDPEALAAIGAHIDGLDGLSKERIGNELLKLLAAPDPAPSLAVMRATGALMRVLNGADDRANGLLVHLEQGNGVGPAPLRRLAALGGMDVQAALRLSKQQDKTLTLYRGEMGSASGAGELGYRHGVIAAKDILLLRAAQFESEVACEDFNAADIGANATFPVAAQDLMPQYSGAQLGAELRTLEQRWIDSGFQLSKKALLS